MEYTYQILTAHKLIVEKVSGGITLEELAEKTNKLLSDPGYDTAYAGVIDLRGTESQITRTELYGFANYINQSDQFGKSKWALIADTPVIVALSQIFQRRLHAAENIGIFCSVQAAADFLQNPAVLEYLKD